MIPWYQVGLRGAGIVGWKEKIPWAAESMVGRLQMGSWKCTNVYVIRTCVTNILMKYRQQQLPRLKVFNVYITMFKNYYQFLISLILCNVSLNCLFRTSITMLLLWRRTWDWMHWWYVEWLYNYRLSNDQSRRRILWRFLLRRT